VGAPNPDSHVPPGHADKIAAPRGEEARGILFAAFLRACDLPVEIVSSSAAPLAAEEERISEAIEALCHHGVWRPPGTDVELVCESLEALPRCGEWLTALDARALRSDLDTMDRYRLGKLLAASGELEKAANCYRQVLTRPEPLCFALALELAEAAAAGDRPALAYAAIDRLAAVALHEPGEHGHPEERSRAKTLGALLSRGREAALRSGSPTRAAALGRAAVNFLERAHLGPAMREAQLGAIEALCASGQPDLAMGYAKRMRESAVEDQDPEHEALAILAASRQLERDNEIDKALALKRRAAAILEERGEQVLAAEPRRLAGELLARRGQIEQARQEVAGAAEQLETGDHASDPTRRRLALQLRMAEVGYALRLGKPASVLKRADQIRRGYEDLGDKKGAASALVVLAHALLLVGDQERAWKALERAAEDLDLCFSRASSFRLRAELRCLEGDVRAARLLLHDAERTFLEAQDPEWQYEALLRRGELLFSQGELDSAREVLAQLTRSGADPNNRFELRRELLVACLSEDDDEVELLLEDLHAQAENEGQLADRVLVAAAKAKRHLERDDLGQAESTIQPVLASLLEFRKDLPGPFQKGLRSSPLGRPVLELADAIKSAKDDD
jgi:tetratricopeptide (TPR) repeat protein